MLLQHSTIINPSCGKSPVKGTYVPVNKWSPKPRNHKANSPGFCHYRYYSPKPEWKNGLCKIKKRSLAQWVKFNSDRPMVLQEQNIREQLRKYDCVRVNTRWYWFRQRIPNTMGIHGLRSSSIPCRVSHQEFEVIFSHKNSSMKFHEQLKK